MPRHTNHYLQKILDDFFKDEELRIQKRFYKEPPKKKVNPTHFLMLKRDKRFSKQAVIKLLSNLGARGVYNAVNYIIRHSEYDYAMNECGQKVSAKEIMKEWKQTFSTKENAKEAWHLCFSIREEVKPSTILALQKSVNATLQKHFYAYQYIQVIHTHQNNPHIHVIINKNNMLTNKKLSFKTKDSLKNFFHEMRSDFADSLNYHGNLHYYNAYKYEKTNILEKKEFLEKREKRNYYRDSIEQVAKDKKSIDVKLQNLETKEKKLQEHIKACKLEREKIFSQLRIYTEQYKAYINNESIRKPSFIESKKLWDTISTFNQNLQAYYTTQRSYKQEIKKLQKQSNDLGFFYMRQRDTFSKTIHEDSQNILAKEAYLDYILQHKKHITKNQLYIAQDIQKELQHNTKEITQNLLAMNEMDSMFLRHLGIKANSKSLLFAKKDITKKLHILKSLNKKSLIDTKLLDEYKETLHINSMVLDKIINERILQIESYFSDTERAEKMHRNTLLYYYNEFKNLTDYLNKQIELREKDTEKDTENTTTLKDKEKLNLLQQRVNNFYTEATKAKEHDIKQKEEDRFYYAFIDWYMIDRNLERSAEYMRKRLRDKYHNNTLHEYLEKYDKMALDDYEYHLFKEKREKEMQATQQTTMQSPSNSHNKGLER